MKNSFFAYYIIGNFSIFVDVKTLKYINQKIYAYLRVFLNINVINFERSIMKKIIVSLLLMCSVVFAAQSMSVADKGCIEDLENEVVKIVNSKVDGEERQKVIDILKGRVSTDTHETCESSFEDEIKKIVFGDKKTEPSEMIKKHAEKSKKEALTADINAQDCIENFEAEVLKIINSNPDNMDKDKTKRIMHEIMHEKVVESCEAAFEEETKKMVHEK